MENLNTYKLWQEIATTLELFATAEALQVDPINRESLMEALEYTLDMAIFGQPVSSIAGVDGYSSVSIMEGHIGLFSKITVIKAVVIYKKEAIVLPTISCIEKESAVFYNEDQIKRFAERLKELRARFNPGPRRGR